MTTPLITGVLQSTGGSPLTLNGGDLQFSLNADGRLQYRFITGSASREVLVYGYECDGLSSLPGDTASQSGGVFGCRETFSTTTRVIASTGGTGQRVKGTVGEGGKFTIFDSHSKVLYFVNYFITEVAILAPLRTARITIEYSDHFP